VEADFRALRSSESSLDRLSAPGLLLRFWVPRDRQARQRLLAGAGTNESPLLTAIRRWHESLSAGVRHAATNAAAAEADDVRELLSDLAARTEAYGLSEAATRMALRRDRLESIRRVLAAVGNAEPLTHAIGSIDELATRHLTLLAEAGVSDARLRRALTSEPDAWWALIGD
jgi:hypothetical protein